MFCRKEGCSLPKKQTAFIRVCTPHINPDFLSGLTDCNKVYMHVLLVLCTGVCMNYNEAVHVALHYSFVLLFSNLSYVYTRIVRKLLSFTKPQKTEGKVKASDNIIFCYWWSGWMSTFLIASRLINQSLPFLINFTETFRCLVIET